jgi:hypothetical protein
MADEVTGRLGAALGVSSSGPQINPFKIAVITSLSNEMIAHSNAESMIRALLIENTAPALDAAMFSANDFSEMLHK